MGFGIWDTKNPKVQRPFPGYSFKTPKKEKNALSLRKAFLKKLDNVMIKEYIGIYDHTNE
jgi:hypothetical protein